jgi:hypothetical protein
MMAVPVKTGPAFEPGVAITLFDRNVTGFFPYDSSAPTGDFSATRSAKPRRQQHHR